MIALCVLAAGAAMAARTLSASILCGDPPWLQSRWAGPRVVLGVDLHGGRASSSGPCCLLPSRIPFVSRKCVSWGLERCNASMTQIRVGSRSG